MKNFSNIKVLALILAYSSFAMADHHASSKHDSQVKYISYSQLGNPADVFTSSTSVTKKSMIVSQYIL